MMKRLNMVAAAGLVLFGVAACGSEAGQATVADTPVTVTVPTTVTETDVTTVTETTTETEYVIETLPPTTSKPLVTNELYVPPSGFTEFGVSGSGISYMFSDPESFDCIEEFDSCWDVSIHTQDGCPKGGNITLDIYRKGSDAVLDDLSVDFVSAAGETAHVLLGQTGLNPNDEILEADVRKISCSR